jgi:hypothetical protein
MIVVYDKEQFRNYHSCFAIDINSEQEYFFEISDYQDDSEQYYNWLKQCKGMIGYNNLNYDYPLIEAFIKLFNQGYRGSKLARLLFEASQEIIKNKWSFPEWKVKIPQRDLYRIYHFDNMAKRTSLKDIQFAMRWKNVKDLPFKFNHWVSEQDREEIKYYNKNDVLSTLEFYKKSEKIIKLRHNLRKDWKINCLNWSDSKIGESLFLKLISEKKDIPVNVLRKQRTNRKEINLSDCLLNYKIENQELQPFIDFITNKKIDTDNIKGALDFRLIFKGMPYDLGLGGVHGYKQSGVYKSTSASLIKSSDVKSYYPNLCMQYKFYPEHLGIEFCEAYEDIYKLKTEAEELGLKDQRAFAKLGLNSAYGKSGDKFSFLHDFKYLLTTTINGQIMLVDLAISLQKAGFDIFLINTDGLEAIVSKEFEHIYEQICQQWCDKTNFILEHNTYKTLALRDVNNFVGEFIDSERKYKGAFEIKKDWHKDHSALIIPKALEAYFLNNTPVSDFVNNSNDIFDYCQRVKSNSGYEIQYHYIQNNRLKYDVLQKINRVYLSNSGGYLYKTNGTRTEGVFVKQKVTVFNEFIELDDYNINKDWYIREINKIIDILEPKQLSLF